MLDPRVDKLADVLVNYSVAIRPGDKVVIRGDTLAEANSPSERTRGSAVLPARSSLMKRSAAAFTWRSARATRKAAAWPTRPSTGT